ncbi:MAG: Sensor histidine kinase YycG [Lentisphaerae bacterium ADurb.BinA184]|nr:MAG: Sensor histidine kinase YycG [Lentisphaerae bacterium ADurb.BinA184]
MKYRLLIACWLLLLVASVVIGVLALGLVRREQRRVVDTAREALHLKAQTLADRLALAVAEAEGGVLRELAEIPAAELPERLRAWENSNPLIRNGFLWQEKTGLLIPSPGSPATREESRFMLRYEPLFSGRVPWPATVPQGADGEAAATDARADGSLYRLSRFTREDAGGQQSRPRTAARSGCLPWFFENRLYLLAWMAPDGEDTVRGVELETMALLSRLSPLLPAQPAAGQAFAILADDGQVVHQAGSVDVTAGVRPVAAAAVGGCLPHWTVAVYDTDLAARAAGSRTVLLLTGLLVACFAAAIVAAGSVLVWLACRHQGDARRKTSFVSNVSHELKTPLTTIRMYAELLSQGRVAEEDKRRKYLEVIVTQSERLTRLVNNVLSFSRLEQGRRPYRPEALDTAEVLESVLDEQAERLRESGMRVTRSGDWGAGAVTADRDAVHQIFLNLVDNAIKYAAGGGELEIGLVRDPEGLAVGFGDRGPGIPPAHRRRLFRQFHRVDESLTAGAQGCGLGLSISRRMARDLGGDLRFAPRPGGGSLFTVLLPSGDASRPRPGG